MSVQSQIARKVLWLPLTAALNPIPVLTWPANIHWHPATPLVACNKWPQALLLAGLLACSLACSLTCCWLTRLYWPLVCGLTLQSYHHHHRIRLQPPGLTHLCKAAMMLPPSSSASFMSRRTPLVKAAFYLRATTTTTMTATDETKAHLKSETISDPPQKQRNNKVI